MWRNGYSDKNIDSTDTVMKLRHVLTRCRRLKNSRGGDTSSLDMLINNIECVLERADG